MSRRLETIGISDDALKAAKKMRDKRISSLVVLDDSAQRSAVGILTERDLVRRVCAEGVNSKNVPVKLICSSPVVTIDPKSSIEVAASSMLSNGVRHLLVLDRQGKPQGLLTPSDFTKYLKQRVNQDQVSATILEALFEDEEPGIA